MPLCMPDQICLSLLVWSTHLSMAGTSTSVLAVTVPMRAALLPGCWHVQTLQRVCYTPGLQVRRANFPAVAQLMLLTWHAKNHVFRLQVDTFVRAGRGSQAAPAEDVDHT